MKPSASRNGRVVTFYSYKGGTGRSMALSNLAWILASAGKRVLVIDWDLEAPGLHRYFRPFLIDGELSASDGLMDLVDRYACEAIRPPPEGQALAPDWWWPLSDISEHVLPVDLDGFARRRGLDSPAFPAGGGIDLLPAGRQCDTYAVKVSAFNWQNFFDRLGGGGFLDAVRQRARAAYDYVLIDSRTGVSDTAGICTAQLPDTLVVCFTYNNQSIKGAAAVAASARRLQGELAGQRRRSDAAPLPGSSIADSPLPYRVLPVPMRVDAGESDRLALRQAFAREAFAGLLSAGHLGSGGDPAAYWASVEVPHRVFYAYEEVLAPFRDDPNDPKSVLSAFVRLAREVTGGEVSDYRLPVAPELRQALLEAYAETPQTAAAQQATQVALRETEYQLLARQLETVLQALGEDDRVRARSVLGRLVRLGGDDEGGGQFPIRVALTELPEAQRDTAAQLAQRAVLSVVTGQRAGPDGSQVAEQTVALASDKLLALSPTLQGWLAEDRAFLLWRQQLRAYRADWVRSGDRSALLAGSPLSEARLWARRRPQDLNAHEHAYIEASIDASEVTQPPPVAVAPPVAAPPFTTTAAMTLPPLQPVDLALPPARAAGSRVGWAVAGTLVLAVLAGSWVLWKPAAAPKAAPAAAAGAEPPATVPSAEVLQQQLAAANRLYESGKLGEAEAAYGQVLALAPTNQTALLQLGRINDNNGNFAASANWYEQAIAAAPQDPQPLIERAASLISAGTLVALDKALADLDRALQLDPRNALAHFNRGVAHENRGRRKPSPADLVEAVADYTRAIAQNRGLAQAYLRRAALVEKTDPAKARADYQSVLGLPEVDGSVQTAQQRLKALGVPDKQSVAAPGGQRVFIQYCDAADQAMVDALRQGLSTALARVSLPGIEKVSACSDGELRYFFADDRALAERTASAAEAELARLGKARTLRLTYRDAKAFPSAVPGTVEVWLPSLSFVAPSRSLKKG